MLKFLGGIFGQKKPVSPAEGQSDAKNFTDIIADTIGEQLSGELFKNSKITVIKDVVDIQPQNIKIKCHLAGVNEHQNANVYNLGFVTQFRSGKEIIEELASVATSDFVGALEGAGSFCSGFMKTVSMAFEGYHDPDFSIEVYDKNEVWHVTVGNLQVQGAFQTDEDLDDKAFIKALYPALQQVIPQLDGDLFFIKVYMSRLNGSEFMGDCFFDNHQWDPGMNLLLHQDYNKWKATDDFLGKKQFIILRKCGALI